jgi:frataxin-like iron-binding protein CyaY
MLFQLIKNLADEYFQLMIRFMRRISSGGIQSTRIFPPSSRIASESSFDLEAIRELTEITDSIEGKIEDLGAESVDLHEGVLAIEFPNGTFVLNKHSASRQIWFSSPVSPPAYFDLFAEDTRLIWWSNRLGSTLRSKLSHDIHSLTGKTLDLD